MRYSSCASRKDLNSGNSSCSGLSIPFSQLPLVTSRSSIFMLPALRSIVDCLNGGVQFPRLAINSSLYEDEYFLYPLLSQNSWNCLHVNRVYSLLRIEYPCFFRMAVPSSMRSLIGLSSNILTALHVETSFTAITILHEQRGKVRSYFQDIICYDEGLKYRILCAVKSLQSPVFPPFLCPLFT